MFRLLFGVFLASLVLFFFGFLYWGLNPLPYTAWSAAQDEPRAIDALRQHFPERGTYFVPSRDPNPTITEDKFKKGPLAFVFVLSPKGRAMEDPAIMVRGYLLSLLGLLLIGYQMRMVRVALPGFGSRVLFAAMSGLIASVMILLGDVVWWQMHEDWKLWQALYHIIGWTLAGAVLARYIDDRPAAATASPSPAPALSSEPAAPLPSEPAEA